MNRRDAEMVAEAIVTAQAAVIDHHPEFLPGIRLLAVMLTDTVCRNGAIEPHTYHTMAAIPPPQHRVTFRGRLRREAMVEDRWSEIHQAQLEEQREAAAKAKPKRKLATASA